MIVKFPGAREITTLFPLKSGPRAARLDARVIEEAPKFAISITVKPVG